MVSSNWNLIDVLITTPYIFSEILKIKMHSGILDINPKILFFDEIDLLFQNKQLYESFLYILRLLVQVRNSPWKAANKTR